MKTQTRPQNLESAPCSAAFDRIGAPRRTPAALVVRGIDDSAHLGFLLGDADPESVSFLQSPVWGRVKPAWRTESLGWFENGRLVGTALVLYRDLPHAPLLGRRSLAYLPEGPTVDWFGSGRRAADWLDPLVVHLRAAGVFAVKMGPKLVGRAWDAAAVKLGMADPEIDVFATLPGSCRNDPAARRLVEELAAIGWRRRGRRGNGITDTQPRHFVRIRLTGRDRDAVYGELDAQWRRNTRIAERAGVKVRQADATDLPVFHALYMETARRDAFTPRPLSYFERMFREMCAAAPDGIRLYLAGVDGFTAAAAIMVRFGRHAWFAYGASTAERRELRASNALHWRMVEDCIADGIEFYDLRGVAETLDPGHPMYGLLRFKIGTGGEIVEYPGEYDLALTPVLDRAVRSALAVRGRLRPR
jgi:lipid II:glycine glycyltransferase (peptidoglycan interpeptide bridge formation enzyme)